VFYSAPTSLLGALIRNGGMSFRNPYLLLVCVWCLVVVVDLIFLILFLFFGKVEKPKINLKSNNNLPKQVISGKKHFEEYGTSSSW